MVMNRHKIVWSGFPGQPGYTNFYTGSSIVDSTPFKTFFNSAYNIAAGASGWLPANTILTFPSSGDQIEESTGALLGSWTGTAPTVLQSNATSNQNYSGAAGAQVQWLTSLVVNRRRVHGSTFLVPLLPVAMDAQGSIGTAALAQMKSAADALVTALAGELKVWSRPFVPGPNNPPIGQPGHKTPRAGANAQVIAARVPDLAVTLRSRRT